MASLLNFNQIKKDKEKCTKNYVNFLSKLTYTEITIWNMSFSTYPYFAILYSLLWLGVPSFYFYLCPIFGILFRYRCQQQLPLGTAAAGLPPVNIFRRLDENTALGFCTNENHYIQNG